MHDPHDDMNGGDLIIGDLDDHPFVEVRTLEYQLLLEPPSPNGKHHEPPETDEE
jgi:hypothetical protein